MTLILLKIGEICCDKFPINRYVKTKEPNTLAGGPK